MKLALLRVPFLIRGRRNRLSSLPLQSLIDHQTSELAHSPLPILEHILRSYRFSNLLDLLQIIWLQFRIIFHLNVLNLIRRNLLRILVSLYSIGILIV